MKSVLGLALVAILIISIPSTVFAQVAVIGINEIELNSNNNSQWIELYNSSDTLIDLSGWLIKSFKLGRTFKIPQGFVITPNGYLVLPFESAFFDINNEMVILLNKDSVEADRTALITDTAKDDRTWQRFPDKQDTNSDGDWVFKNSTISKSNGFPVIEQNFKLSAPSLIDQQGNKLEAFTGGQMIGVEAEITNKADEEVVFTYIVKARDEEGFTVFISWIQDVIVPPNRTLKPAIFWYVSEDAPAGNYLVEIFAWKSLRLPEVLAPAQSTLVRISG